MAKEPTTSLGENSLDIEVVRKAHLGCWGRSLCVLEDAAESAWLPPAEGKHREKGQRGSLKQKRERS